MAREVIEDLPAPQQQDTEGASLSRVIDWSNVDVSDHLNYLYRGTHGYICLASLDRSNGARPKERWFKWPEERDDAIEWVEGVKDKPWVEVFYCVNPMRTKDRAAGNSSARYVVHADVDTVLSGSAQRRLRRLGFRFISSGTPGRVHVLARLSRSLTLPEHKAVERALKKLTNADAKISDNDYLRMPGTWNNKHHPSVDAGKRNRRKLFCEITWAGKETVSADRVITDLGVTVLDTDQVARSSTTIDWTRVRKPRIKDRLLAVIDIDPEPGRRSEQCYAAVSACVEEGWDRDQIHTVLDDFAPGLDKWGSDRWHRELDRILVKRSDAEGGGLEPYDIEAEFWDSRPILKHIHTAAQASLASPWATLGVVMTRVLYCIPPNVEVPKLTGTRAGGGSGSVNLFVALIGHSGAGKMTATTAGADAIETGQLIRGMSIGSGEGISKAFKGKGDGDSLERKAIWFDVSEVSTWNAVAGRQGATLSAEVCRAWSGEALGFQNADKEKTNHVMPGTYRMSLVVGAQPGQCGPLLGSLDMGLPQRFLFLPTWDDDLPDEDIPMPDPWAWEMPAFDKDGYTVKVPDEIRKLMRAQRRAQMKSTYKGDPLESHALLIRLRVAFGLALLDDRVDVAEEDWDLAGTVMHIHGKTRAMVMDTLEHKRRIENKRRGEDEGDRRFAADRRVEVARNAEIEKAAELLAHHLRDTFGGTATGGKLKSKLNATRRHLFDSAMTHLVDTRKVKPSPIQGGGTKGVRYTVIG